MASELSTALGDEGEADAREPTRASVFGLDVLADPRLYFLADAQAVATGRTLAIEIAAAGAELAWPDTAKQLCEQREPDGSLSYRIEADQRGSYLISGPAYGAHLLSGDGRRLSCAPPGDAGDSGWQRLLIAQTLPFAALLNGLEVFHASAVAIDGRAVAFLGTSRAGKTSIALELCRRGASFLADDVLALERSGSELLGHPGTPVAGVDRDEVQRLKSNGSWSEGDVVAVNDRELVVRLPVAEAAAPLAALFFLDRRPDGPSDPRFEPVIDPRLLLASTFNFVLATPSRLSSLLDVCALAAAGRVERVIVGLDADPPRLGDAILARLRARV